MATFKHISSKNADYGAAEQYLTFEHDEFTMKPTLDENGRLMLREDYRIATLNCGDEDFAVACMRSNLRYGKNQKREDVKSHHYIISFDPRDAVDNGLTVDRAQALGEEFCRKQFPGHQAIVCTHPDGHNHSGNIHVHIVINSLRIEEVPFLPYMDRPADTRAGCKHRCTDAAMEYFKAEVMELCHRENLYQIDLLHGSKNRITEREYWAQRKGQAKLDKEAAALPAEEQPAKPTKFETDKEKLRQAIRTALSSAASYGEFTAVLLQQGVTVKESRGRLSYLTPDRTKPITARKLGDDFDRAAVLALLEQNAHRAAEQTATVPEYPRNIRERLQGKKAVQTTPEKDGIQRMVDRAAKRAEGKGVGYDKVLGASNLAMLRYEWVWYKSRCTGFLNARRAPLKRTENILVFYQKLPYYDPQFEQGKPYKKISRTGDNSPNYGKFLRSSSGSEDGLRFPGNLLAFSSVQRTIHPTQKPVELCEYLIRTYTRPGEVVADICAGSGTTAVAAVNTGRRFVCFETAPAFYAPATERIRLATEAVKAGQKGV